MVKYRYAAMLCVAMLLAACGGGSDSSNASTSAPAVVDVSTVTFEPGVFPVSTNFEALCESPRSGIDAFSGQAFPDAQGSDFLEKMWLRSWTYESYLWFDEVADNDPNNFTVLEYFNQLRTEELTESGRPRDNFHFSQNTQEFNELSQSGVTRGYGFNFQRNSSSVPREFIVRFTEPGSAAGLANIPRGAVLTEVDGVDFVNGGTNAEVDAINNALFPADAGSVHQFGFRLNDGTNISVQLTSEDVLVSPLQNVAVVDTNIGPVGYMQFNSFNVTAQDALIDAFELFDNQGVSELVMDLRYNGGGRLALASQIAYMVAGPQSQGDVFETLLYNGKFEPDNTIEFYDREIDYDEGVFLNAILPSTSLSRVFILSTENTCSASESVINGLRGIGVEVVLIGDTTCGKPFGFLPTDNCGTTYFTIQFQSVNAQGFGEFQDGFIPTQNPIFGEQVQGCVVNDDFSLPLGNQNEALFATALDYMVNGVNACPPQVAQTTLATQSEQTAVAERRKDIIIQAIANESIEPILEQN